MAEKCGTSLIKHSLEPTLHLTISVRISVLVDIHLCISLYHLEISFQLIRSFHFRKFFSPIQKTFHFNLEYSLLMSRRLPGYIREVFFSIRSEDFFVSVTKIFRVSYYKDSFRLFGAFLCVSENSFHL